MDGKSCFNCGKFKPLSEYGQYKQCKSGLRYECKTCQHKMQKLYRKRKSGKKHDDKIEASVLYDVDKYIMAGQIDKAIKHIIDTRNKYYLHSGTMCRLKQMELAVEQMAERAKNAQ